MKFYQRVLQRLSLFFGVFGPATITAISDNDAAGIATYSLAGANFGYSILFVLFFVTILLAVTQEMGTRLAIVTGKGLGDLIRERFGVRVSLFVFLALLTANIGTLIANFSALKAVSGMFNIPSLPFIITIIFISFLFISKGNYKTNQNIFFVGIILYFSYIISAFKAGPDWGKAVTSLVIPTDIKWSKEFIIASIAVLGTTITPWGQFFIQSYVNDKKIPLDKLKYSQFETYFGAFLTDFLSFFMIIATAATLFIYKIPLTSGEQAALAIKPFAGELAGVLFGIGLLNAGLMGVIIIALSTAYAFSEFFGFEGSLDAPFERGKIFYGIFILQLIIAASVVMIPSISLFKIVFFTQSFNAILLPAVFYFLLQLTNNKELMGKYVNTKTQNYISVVATIIIVVAATIAVFGTFIG